MPDSGAEIPPKQNNYGSGPLIGRDNYGDIRYETLDPKTKVALNRLSKDAPDLAQLLARALRDGVISPEAVAALENAVRYINEDVANSLQIAGRNINEDVASMLYSAGQCINADVANQIDRTGTDLNEVADRLDSILRSFKNTISIAGQTISSSGTGLAAGIDSQFPELDGHSNTSLYSRFAVWKIKAQSFVLGAVAGAVIIAILIGEHVKPF